MTKRTQKQSEQKIVTAPSSHSIAIVSTQLETVFPKVLVLLMMEYWSRPLYSSEQYVALVSPYIKSSKELYRWKWVHSTPSDEKICQTVDIPNVSWEGVSIKNVGFSKINLNGLDIPMADIVSAGWLYCSLTESYFSATTFQSVSFNSCTITNGDFYNCKMIDVKFLSNIRNGLIRQVIKGVNFDNSHFEDTTFHYINFNNTHFRKAKFHKAINFFNCEMHNCDFTDADFSKIKRYCLSISNSIIEKVQFTAVNFKGCSLYGTKFDACNFDQVNFSDAKLKECDFSSCSLKGANLKRANIAKSSFAKSHLYQTDFSGALNVLGAEFKDTSVEEKAEGLLDIVREEIANCFMQTTSVHGKNRALKLLGSLCRDEKNTVNTDVLIHFIKSGKVTGVDTFTSEMFGGKNKSDIGKPNSILGRIAKRLAEFDPAKTTLASTETEILAALRAATASIPKNISLRLA